MATCLYILCICDHTCTADSNKSLLYNLRHYYIINDSLDFVITFHLNLKLEFMW